MGREIDFIDGDTVVPAAWLNARQELVSGGIFNMRLEKSGTNAIRITNVDTTEPMGIVIDGLIRYASAAKTVTMSGGAATYSVYLAAAAEPSRDFTIGVWNEGVTSDPVGVANYRKIGTVVWNGSSIDGVPTSMLPLYGNAPMIANATGTTPDLSDDSIRLATTEWVRDFFNSTFALMIGEVRAYAGAALPTGWLWCDGSEISRTTYAALFAIIGTAFGAGNGTTTFNLPDLRSRTIVGPDNMDNAVGVGGGAANRMAQMTDQHGENVIPGVTRGVSGGQYRRIQHINEMAYHRHIVDSHDHAMYDHGTTAIAGTNHAEATARTTGAAVANNVSAGTDPNGGHSHKPSVASNFRVTNDTGNYQLKSTQIVGGAGSGYYAINNTSVNEDTNMGGSHSHGVSISQNYHYHKIAAQAPNTNYQGGSSINYPNMPPFQILPMIIRATAA